MSRLRDLSGMEFGRLSVVERAGNAPSGESKWLCLCECGEERVVSSGNLRTGHTRSFCCLRIGRSWKSGVVSKMNGKRFGRWLVIERAEREGTSNDYWLCRCDCGTEKVVSGYNMRRGQSKSCGCMRDERLRSRSGEDNPCWRGGRSLASGGYISILDRDHPNANDRGRVLEHVAVMSRALGRPLRKGETVHHVNGVRDDNRLENLELWSSSHPSGQRVVDKVEWARRILADYEQEIGFTPDPALLRGRRAA